MLILPTSFLSHQESSDPPSVGRQGVPHNHPGCQAVNHDAINDQSVSHLDMSSLVCLHLRIVPTY